MGADSGNLVERRKGRKGTSEDDGSGLSPSTSRDHATPMTRSSSSSKLKSGSSTNSFLSSKTFLVLCVGILTGYVALPMILVEINMESYLAQMGGGSSSSGDFTNNGGGLRALVSADNIQQRLVEDHMMLSQQSLPTSTSPTIMTTQVLSDHKRKKILVTGGAGFVGSHLVDKLMMEGHEVIVMDNFFTGQKKNIAHWLHHPNFR